MSNDYVDPALYPPGDAPGQGNSSMGSDSYEPLERESVVGTTDEDTEAQTSTPVNYGNTDPTYGYVDSDDGGFFKGVSDCDFRPAVVPIGRGGENSGG